MQKESAAEMRHKNSMKRCICFLLILLSLFLLCSCSGDGVQSFKDGNINVSELNYCVAEPDEFLMLDENDKKIYSDLTDGIFKRESRIKVSDDREKNLLYIDILRQNPYFFFVEDYSLKNDTVEFSYKYSEEEQKKLKNFMDDELLKIVNYQAEETDNELDHILKVYACITSSFKYDKDRTDNKQPGSPLFDYPADEVYKTLRDKKCLCYGFAYTLRFCLQQYGIECFKISGYCNNTKCGHMWNIFKYDGEYFNCDSGWDITDKGNSKLYHFGKTDNERTVDTLDFPDFGETHYEGYPEVSCTDERFKMFRGIKKYRYTGNHEYYLVDRKKTQYIFNTETFELK